MTKFQCSTNWITNALLQQEYVLVKRGYVYTTDTTTLKILKEVDKSLQPSAVFLKGILRCLASLNHKSLSNRLSVTQKCILLSLAFNIAHHNETYSSYYILMFPTVKQVS